MHFQYKGVSLQYKIRDSNNQKKKEIMTKQELIKQIKTLAAEEGISFIEACQAMQSAAAKMNNEKMIMTIHNIKMDSLNQ